MRSGHIPFLLINQTMRVATLYAVEHWRESKAKHLSYQSRLSEPHIRSLTAAELSHHTHILK